MTKRRWTSYSDSDKDAAILMLQAAGYPNTDGALERASKESGVPRTTLRNWFNNEHGAPQSKVRHIKKGEIVARLDRVISKLVEHLYSIADSGDVRETAITLGVVVDKRQLLSGDPTENLQSRIIIEYDSDSPAATV